MISSELRSSCQIIPNVPAIWQHSFVETYHSDDNCESSFAPEPSFSSVIATNRHIPNSDNLSSCPNACSLRAHSTGSTGLSVWHRQPFSVIRACAYLTKSGWVKAFRGQLGLIVAATNVWLAQWQCAQIEIMSNTHAQKQCRMRLLAGLSKANVWLLRAWRRVCMMHGSSQWWWTPTCRVRMKPSLH